jgi:uncharacterized protein YjbI with pentapeptide repeats
MATLLGAVIALGATFTVQAFATGSSGPTIVYGCITTNHTLTKVGLTAPKCGSLATPVQLNSYAENANGMPQCTGIPHYGIDLSGCELKGSSLSGVNLSLANLSNADLTGVNFTNTELNGADLTGANLTAVTWSNTTCPDQTNSNNDGGTCINNLG